MSKPTRFETLIAWQKAHILTKRIYEVTRTGPFARDFGLGGQLQRASVSLMTNIAEGSERGSRDFHQFLVTATASAAEVRSHLFAAFDAHHIDEQPFQELNALVTEVGQIIGALHGRLLAISGSRKTAHHSSLFSLIT